MLAAAAVLAPLSSSWELHRHLGDTGSVQFQNTGIFTERTHIILIRETPPTPLDHPEWIPGDGADLPPDVPGPSLLRRVHEARSFFQDL